MEGELRFNNTSAIVAERVNISCFCSTKRLGMQIWPFFENLCVTHSDNIAFLAIDYEADPTRDVL